MFSRNSSAFSFEPVLDCLLLYKYNNRVVSAVMGVWTGRNMVTVCAGLMRGTLPDLDGARPPQRKCHLPGVLYLYPDVWVGAAPEVEQNCFVLHTSVVGSK